MDYRKLDVLAKEGTSVIQERISKLRLQEQVEVIDRGYYIDKKVHKRSKGVRRGIRRLLAAQTRAKHRERTIESKAAVSDKTRTKRTRLKEEREFSRDGEVVDTIDRGDELPILEIKIHQPWPGAKIAYVISVKERSEWNPQFRYLAYELDHRFFYDIEEAVDLCNRVIEKEAIHQQAIRMSRRSSLRRF